jgi:hypothetical protein
MPSKKLKLKNKKMRLIKIRKGFLILTFWGAFCHLDKFAFFNQHKILNFLIPCDLFQEKKFRLLSEGPFFKFFDTKTRKKKIETPQNKEK